VVRWMCDSGGKLTAERRRNRSGVHREAHRRRRQQTEQQEQTPQQREESVRTAARACA
jgi:hypothetical protein